MQERTTPIEELDLEALERMMRESPPTDKVPERRAKAASPALTKAQKKRRAAEKRARRARRVNR